MAEETYDLVVIGSGPGGYTGAIRAGQLGMKTACIEKYRPLGGTCLNVGCIPSKALLESSEQYHAVTHDLAAHGINVESVSLDLDAMMERKRGIVGQLTGGIEYLFKKNKVDRYHGTGSIKSATEVVVTDKDGNEKILETKKILIATGSVVASLPGIEIDEERIVSSTGALEIPEVPEHLIVIGAGVIGLELGSVWARLGAKVTVLEYLPRILAASDGDIAKRALRVFKKQGLDFHLGVKVTGANVDDDKVTVTYEGKDETHTIQGDRLLVSVGRKPCTTGLGAQEAGIEIDDRGRIQVDDNFQTNVEGIFAIGDVIAGPMLAHKAEEEAVVCVERINGIGAHVNYDAIPDVVYTWPEVAGVGKTEEAVKEAGRDYKVGTFPFSANGRAKALGCTEGLVKIIADAKTDAVLGCHIFGPRAGDLIAEVAVAIEFGASSEDIARSSHAHPTLAEVVKEAALAVDGRALNM